jgi:hypothetical protein
MDPDGYVLAAGVTNQWRCDGRVKHQDGVESFDSVLCSTSGDPDGALRASLARRLSMSAFGGV